MSRQCVILAGGLATRLGARATVVPKHLQLVGGRPFADLQLGRLRELGIERVVYCIGHLGDQIRDHVGDGAAFGLDVRYVEDGPRPAGTAGALRRALQAGALDDVFFLTYGDSLLRADLAAMERRLVDGAAAVMSVLRNRGAFDRSNVALAADGRVAHYGKTNEGELEWIDYGLLLWRRDAAAAELLPAAGDLDGVLSQLAREGRLAAFEAHERFYEIGSPTALEELETRIVAEAEAQPPVVVLDRDGVINELVVDAEQGTIDSPLHPSQVALRRGAGEAVRRLRDLGYHVAIASNQPAAAKGKTTRENLLAVHRAVLAELAAEGAEVRSSHLCLHRAEDGCRCRKPKTGLLDIAMGVASSRRRAKSWMVGDGITDVQAGRAAGLRTALLAPDKLDLRSVVERAGAPPDLWVEDLPAFAARLEAAS